MFAGEETAMAQACWRDCSNAMLANRETAGAHADKQQLFMFAGEDTALAL
jgi:hypothetical protein